VDRFFLYSFVLTFVKVGMVTVDALFLCFFDLFLDFFTFSVVSFLLSSLSEQQPSSSSDRH
jgi:hypothetical protein